MFSKNNPLECKKIVESEPSELKSSTSPLETEPLVSEPSKCSEETEPLSSLDPMHSERSEDLTSLDSELSENISEAKLAKPELSEYMELLEPEELLEDETEEYLKFVEPFYYELKEILETYQNYQEHGSGARGYWSRYYSGYSYYKKNPHKNFVKLIDRLALMDSSGTWIGSLIDELNKLDNENFNKANKAYFLDRFYLIFHSWQDQFFKKRKEEIDHHKNQLLNAYFISETDTKYTITEKDKKWFHAYFDKIVYDKDSDLKEDPEYKNLLVGKLRYDLEQIRDQIKEDDEIFEQHAKALKKDIHHMAEEWRLPSKIKKRRPTAENPSKYYVEYHANFSNIPKEKAENRKNKKFAGKAASVGAFTSSIGEGLVAALGIIGLWSLMPVAAALGTVGIAGWYINRLLFKNESEDVLKAFFIKKEVDGKKHRLIFLIKDENDNYRPISIKKKTFISIIGLLTGFTGLVNGALNLMSTLAFLHSSQIILGALCITSAAFPATALALAVSLIFFKVIADFIKNDRHKDIAQYVRKTFIDVPWSEMSRKEKAAHVGKCVAKTAICLVAIAVTTIVTIASFGVFYHSCLDVLKKVVNANPMTYVAKAATWINGIISIPFQINTSNKVLQSLVFRKRHTFSKTIETLPTHELTLNALQKEAIKLKKIEVTASLVTNVMNGCGQTGVVASTPEPFLPANAAINLAVTAGCTFPYSFLPNQAAANDAIAQRQVVAADSVISDFPIAPSVQAPVEAKQIASSLAENAPLVSATKNSVPKKIVPITLPGCDVKYSTNRNTLYFPRSKTSTGLLKKAESKQPLLTLVHSHRSKL